MYLVEVVFCVFPCRWYFGPLNAAWIFRRLGMPVPSNGNSYSLWLRVPGDLQSAGHNPTDRPVFHGAYIRFALETRRVVSRACRNWSANSTVAYDISGNLLIATVIRHNYFFRYKHTTTTTK